MVLHQHILPSEAEILIKRRYQIPIAWRPIKTILRDPFAVCDAQSVREDELCPIKIIFPERESESFAVRPPHPNRKGRAQMVLFAQADSRGSVDVQNL